MKKNDDISLQFRPDSPDVLLSLIMILFPLLCNKSIVGAKEILMFRNARLRSRSYRRFRIPKKSGGYREILAPTGILKYIQKAVNLILQLVWEPTDAAHGFTAGRSVMTGAFPHVGKKYVFNVDLKDFFASIDSGMIRRALVGTLGLDRRTAAIIASLCTVPDGSGRQVLPQGSPASPVLSNIVCADLDRRLSGLAESIGLTYTRYADDITFSGEHNAFREGEAFRANLDRIIRDEGFTVNGQKTRLQKRGSRQEVTGLTVCEKVNVSRRWLKRLRAQIHRMEAGGFTREEMLCARGRLSWLRQVRGKDPAWEKLDQRLRRLERQAPPPIPLPS